MFYLETLWIVHKMQPADSGSSPQSCGAQRGIHAIRSDCQLRRQHQHQTQNIIYLPFYFRCPDHIDPSLAVYIYIFLFARPLATYR